jgi:hypothetical protein
MGSLALARLQAAQKIASLPSQHPIISGFTTIRQPIDVTHIGITVLFLFIEISHYVESIARVLLRSHLV